MEKIFRATNYCRHNGMSIKQRYRHTYHAMPQIGWCNDPNGFSYYGGKIHLFYQHNPYSAAWDVMHWGHVTSTDMVKWEYEPIALAPDKDYDVCGCFSGSAIEKDGLLHLMYTGVDSNGLQYQCIASSSDGKVFEKPFVGPVIGANDIPDFIPAKHFRDPYIFKRGKVFYCIVGTKVDHSGNIALFRSTDIAHWSFVGLLFDPNDENFKLSGVYECPTIAELGGKDVIICSPQFKPTDGCKYENIHSVMYMVGKLDCESGRFACEYTDELDGGFDFYAAQVTKLPDERFVMVAWMQMWDREMPTHRDGWAGAMTLPRELTLCGNRLIQTPVREIIAYRKNKAQKANIPLDSSTESFVGISGKTVELDVTLDVGDSKRCGIKVFAGGDNETLIYYDAQAERVTVDRSRSGVSINGKESNLCTRSVDAKAIDGKIKLRVFLDVTSVEVFVNDGKATLTANVYTSVDNNNIGFYAEGGSAVLEQVIKYDIVV